MPKSEAGALLRFIRAFRMPGAGPEDEALLERYVRQRDDAAFELLMWRHAAMVLRVCQDTLQDPFEAEDAFQATFLVLARKAGSISRRESIAGWLYRVALRIALKARKKNSRRNAHEQAGTQDLAEQVSSKPVDEAMPHEWRPVLHEEIARLPAKYRTPMVLCYLEGRTHEQAALELGWAKGTVAGRLARARDLLRRRLTRRGLVLSGGLALTSLASTASAAIPAALTQNTCKAALAFAAGKTTGLSPHVMLLAKGAVHTMLLTKIKFVAISLVTLAVVGGGTGAVIYGVAGSDCATDGNPRAVPATNASKPPAGAAESKRSRNILLVSPRDGLVLKAPDEGDQVKAGQLLVRLDDRLARNQLKIAAAKLAVAKAEFEGAYKTFLEAEDRFEGSRRLYERNPPLIGREEFREKKLARDKFETESQSKKAHIAVAEGDLRNAEIIVEMHEIRSPVNGVVRTVLKGPGEGVKALEAVVEIAPESKKQRQRN